MIVDPEWILLLLLLLFLIILLLLYLLGRKARPTPGPPVVLYSEQTLVECGDDGILLDNLAGDITILVKVERIGECGVILSTNANPKFSETSAGTPSSKISTTILRLAKADQVKFKCDGKEKDDPPNARCEFKVTITRI
jgi:hypothetical protein